MDNFIQITVFCPPEPLELVHLFTEIQERSITTMHCVFVRDLTSAVKVFGLRVTLTPSEKSSINIFRIFCVRKNVNRFCGMRFLACLYVDACHCRLHENLPPQGNEIFIPFSSKHSAPLGGVWNNYSTYFRAVIAGQSNGFSGLFYLFLLWSSPYSE